jgi:type IV pilus assembly protein PilW
MTLRRLARREAGFSMIELMIAMVLGLLVASGIITVFISTSSSNRVQTQLARLQEQGRYAISRLTTDLAQANGQYCTNSGGNAHLGTGGVYVDGARVPTVYAAGTKLMNAMYDNTTPWGSPYPTLPTSPYSLPSFLSMRGYDCTTTACTPMDPKSADGVIPAQGTAVAKRVPGTAVLTMRFINANAGWTIYPTGSATGSTITTSAADGSLTSITLNPTTNEPAASAFASGDLAMLANCSSAQIFAVNKSSTTTLTPAAASSSASPTDGQNFAVISGQQGSSAPKLFDLNTDFQTVTYYVQETLADDGVSQTGALMRRVNGATTADEVVRGVERLDFKYGVQYPDGSTRFLDAKTIDASTSATTGCTVAVLYPADTTNRGCLWRAVKSIEVDLLMDGQVPLNTMSADEMQYTYSTDGKTTLTAPDSFTIKPSDQGFVNPMLRREFTALVSLRNYNP